MGDTAPKIEASAQMRIGSPFTKGDLERFAAAIPETAEVRVTTHHGGSQRDPEINGYTLWARW